MLLVYGLFLFGVVRGNQALSKEAVLQNFFGQKVVVEGVITDDGYYDDKKRVVFSIDAFKIVSPEEIDIDVPIRVNTFVIASATRGEVVRVSGKVFPTVGNVAGSIGFAEVETIGTTVNFISRVRQNFTSGLRNGLPEPAASLAAGILIGQRSSLTSQWQDILRDSGLTHIIAVSGFNLTILVIAMRKLLRNQSRYQIVIFSSLLMAFFVMITGGSPSILRALIVVILLQISWFYGRKFHPLVLLALSAAISLLIDPFQIWRSVGWYLSFAAFFGIVVLAPLLTPQKREKSFLFALIAQCFAAGIMTLPIIAAVFGRVSLVGIIANLLVTPLIPLAMLLSFIAGVVGWIMPTISGWFALPARFVLTYILDIANLTSRLPGARVSLSLVAWQLGLIYTLICSVIWWLYRKRRPKSFVLE